MNNLITLLQFVFQSFWHFIGSVIILGTVLRFQMFIWNRFWRHWTLRKQGYPPTWCDADGDFRPEKK